MKPSSSYLFFGSVVKFREIEKNQQEAAAAASESRISGKTSVHITWKKGTICICKLTRPMLFYITSGNQ